MEPSQLSLREQLSLKLRQLFKRKPRPHHWIEDGTEADFKRNIMESDISVPEDRFPYIPTITYRIVVTRTGRLSRWSSISRPPREIIPRETIVTNFADADINVVLALIDEQERALNRQAITGNRV